MHYRTPKTYNGEDEPNICHYCREELKEGEVFYLYPEVMWENTPAWMRTGSRPPPRKCCKKCHDRYRAWTTARMQEIYFKYAEDIHDDDRWEQPKKQT